MFQEGEADCFQGFKKRRKEAPEDLASPAPPSPAGPVSRGFFGAGRHQELAYAWAGLFRYPGRPCQRAERKSPTG
jgi:hypothetical protein